MTEVATRFGFYELGRFAVQYREAFGERPNPGRRGHAQALPPRDVDRRARSRLLALGFAGAFRRAELVALEVGDLIETPDGLRVLIRRSKGDQEGQAQEIAIPRGCRLRPVEALVAWLAAAEISTEPIFRPVKKGGRVSGAPLSAFSAAEIVKHYATRAGLDPRTFAGRSLRSGFLTSAAEAGASAFKMDGGTEPPLR